MWETPETPFPAKSIEDIQRIQSERKRIAVERAKGSAFFAGKLDHIDPGRLDDPEEWRKIPILTKDQLRVLKPGRFFEDFCIGARTDVVEYWRSGGSTGQPLFYPRSHDDMRFGLESFRRLWLAAAVGPDDLAHISFPLGIHPVGSLFARTGEELGIGTVWCGAGNSTPSELQVELIQTLKPTVFAGMASYGLQLAQVAEKMGVDLSQSSVTKFLTAAEPVSAGKRMRIEKMWGAELYDQFGSTEGAAFSSETSSHDGMAFFSDLFHFEVLDETTLEPVAEGENGILIITSLWNNNITPFLRWNLGDYVKWRSAEPTEGDPLSVYPMIWHAARTSGFFKVRGININHADFDDFMLRQLDVADYKVEVEETEALDKMRVSIELSGGADGAAVAARLARAIKSKFEVTPEMDQLAPGTLEAEFTGQVKQNRFIDKRG
ncbi:MAG: AMP-binding protein [Rhodospirillales bacterium]|jgi:phenylacetate-CoA ligase|nr:AMP-binding protein [Rhodospirillales bacterium]